MNKNAKPCIFPILIQVVHAVCCERLTGARWIGKRRLHRPAGIDAARKSLRDSASPRRKFHCGVDLRKYIYPGPEAALTTEWMPARFARPEILNGTWRLPDARSVSWTDALNPAPIADLRQRVWHFRPVPHPDINQAYSSHRRHW